MKPRLVYSDFRRDMTAPTVYAAIADFGVPGCKFVKVGHTHKLISRLSSIQTGCPVQIGQVAFARMADIDIARRAEALIHQAMARFRSQGEWFKFDLSDVEHVRVWRGAIPAVLNAVVGRRMWSLHSIDYADIRSAAIESSRALRKKIRARRKANWDGYCRANDKIKF